MPIILDILVIAILVLFIVLGAHRGFILTLCSLVAVIVALVGANLLADALAPKMAQALEPRLEQSIQQALEEKAQEVSAVDGLEVADAMVALREKGGLYEWAADSLEEALKSAPVGDAIAHQAAAAATAVAEQLARGVLFSVAFLVILVAWFFLSHALDLVAKLPGLSTLNQTLGGILGLVKGLLILWLLSWILGPLTGVIAAETVAQTHLLLFLTQHGPLELLKLGASLTA